MHTPYDIIASLGDWCAPAANIRRRFGITEAMPFDWWVSPYNGVMKLLEERFSNLLRLENLEIIDDGDSVRCNHYGILHHHDFARDANNRVISDLSSQLEQVVAKHEFIVDRFLRAFEGKRALFVRNGLQPSLVAPGTPMPSADLQVEWATRLHSLLRDRLSPRHLDIVVLSNLEPGRTLSLDGGAVVFEQLGERIKDLSFWDENYDRVFDRLGIQLADRRTNELSSASAT